LGLIEQISRIFGRHGTLLEFLGDQVFDRFVPRRRGALRSRPCLVVA
jgi:hypothetical protein